MWWRPGGQGWVERAEWGTSVIVSTVNLEKGGWESLRKPSKARFPRRWSEHMTLLSELRKCYSECEAPKARSGSGCEQRREEESGYFRICRIHCQESPFHADSRLTQTFAILRVLDSGSLSTGVWIPSTTEQGLFAFPYASWESKSLSSPVSPSSQEIFKILTPLLYKLLRSPATKQVLV